MTNDGSEANNTNLCTIITQLHTLQDLTEDVRRQTRINYLILVGLCKPSLITICAVRAWRYLVAVIRRTVLPREYTP